MNYIRSMADRIKAQTPSDLLPDADVEPLFLLYALLAQVKGEEVDLPDVHDAWATWVALRGEQHPSLVPFDELPEATQREDQPFLEAIREALKNGRGSSELPGS